MSSDMLRGENGERGVLATARDSRVMVPPCAGWDGYIGGRGCCGSPRNAQGSSGLVCVPLERLCMPTAGYSEFRNIPTRKCEYSMMMGSCEYVHSLPETVVSNIYDL